MKFDFAIRQEPKMAEKMNIYVYNILTVLVLLVTALQLTFPQITLAMDDNTPAETAAKIVETGIFYELTDRHGAWDYDIKLPEVDNRDKQYSVYITLTAYNSLPGQTDDTPCITASGFDVCEHNIEDIIATNFNYLPFNTKVKFPELFGDQEFRVQDRMNARYTPATRRADLWMQDYQSAKIFGKKYVQMDVYY